MFYRTAVVLIVQLQRRYWEISAEAPFQDTFEGQFEVSKEKELLMY